MSVTSTKKEISPATNLTALALFTVAQQHYRKVREMETALAELLGYEEDGPYCGCLSDEIYSENGDFAKGMKNEDFVVKTPRVGRR